MRKTIRTLVNKYKKKAKLDSVPTKTVFRDSVSASGRLKTKYEKKTGKLISYEFLFPLKEHQYFARVDTKKAAKFTNFVVAHEVGHLKHNVNQWDKTREIHRTYRNSVLETYANHFATKMTNITNKEYREIEKELANKHNASVRDGTFKNKRRK